MSTDENEDIFCAHSMEFDPIKLREAYTQAVENIGFSQGIVNCISVTRCHDGTASTRGVFWTKDENYNEIQIEKPVKESKYTKIEDSLRGTYFEEIIKKLSARYTLGRVRILKLDSRSSLSYHRDPELRIHIPIVTNPGALVVVKNFATHLPNSMVRTCSNFELGRQDRLTDADPCSSWMVATSIWYCVT